MERFSRRVCLGMDTKYLSDDLIEEILTRLPAKSLLRFQGVCKSWRSLISSEEFIGSHLKQQQSHTFDPLVSFQHSPDRWTHNFYLLRYSQLQSHRKEIRPLDSSFRIHPPGNVGRETCGVELVGFCDGIVCLVCGESNLMICNPSMRKSATISVPQIDDRHFDYYGFGHDASNDDYKIVRLCFEDKRDTVQAHVYSLKSRAWKVIVNDLRNICCLENQSCLAGGHVHWVATTREAAFLLSFDLTYEVFRQTELPLGSQPLLMFDLLPTATKHGKVFLLVRDCFPYPGGVYSLWELGELGVAGSWTELHPGGDPVYYAMAVEAENSRLVFYSFNATGWDSIEIERGSRVVKYHSWVELFDKQKGIINGFANYMESLVMLNYI